MPLFFCAWEDRASLIVDDETRDAAIEVARDVADGLPPQTVRQLPPRAFVAEVFFESEDDGFDPSDSDEDGEALLVEPLPHVSEMLARMHDDDAEQAPAPVSAPAVSGEVDGPSTLCESEAVADDGSVHRCNRAANHDPPHRAGDLVWE